MGICALFYIYTSAKFGIVVFKASMLDWGVHLPWVYCIVLYICHRHGILVIKEMKRFRGFVVSGVLARTPADVQMNLGSFGMHVQW